MSQWINTMRPIQKVDYVLFRLNKEGHSTPATTWMSPEDMLSGKQSQKALGWLPESLMKVRKCPLPRTGPYF